MAKQKTQKGINGNILVADGVAPPPPARVAHNPGYLNVVDPAEASPSPQLPPGHSANAAAGGTAGAGEAVYDMGSDVGKRKGFEVDQRAREENGGELYEQLGDPESAAAPPRPHDYEYDHSHTNGRPTLPKRLSTQVSSVPVDLPVKFKNRANVSHTLERLLADLKDAFHMSGHSLVNDKAVQNQYTRLQNHLMAVFDARHNGLTPEHLTELIASLDVAGIKVDKTDLPELDPAVRQAMPEEPQGTYEVPVNTSYTFAMSPKKDGKPYTAEEIQKLLRNPGRLRFERVAGGKPGEPAIHYDNCYDFDGKPTTKDDEEGVYDAGTDGGFGFGEKQPDFVAYVVKRNDPIRKLYASAKTVPNPEKKGKKPSARMPKPAAHKVINPVYAQASPTPDDGGYVDVGVAEEGEGSGGADEAVYDMGGAGNQQMAVSGHRMSTTRTLVAAGLETSIVLPDEVYEAPEFLEGDLRLTRIKPQETTGVITVVAPSGQSFYLEPACALYTAVADAPELYAYVAPPARVLSDTKGPHKLYKVSFACGAGVEGGELLQIVNMLRNIALLPPIGLKDLKLTKIKKIPRIEKKKKKEDGEDRGCLAWAKKRKRPLIGVGIAGVALAAMGAMLSGSNGGGGGNAPTGPLVLGAGGGNPSNAPSPFLLPPVGSSLTSTYRTSTSTRSSTTRTRRSSTSTRSSTTQRRSQAPSSERPSHQPSVRPSHQPSPQPSVNPSPQPSARPSHQPSPQPSVNPSAQPSVSPSSQPSPGPTHGQPGGFSAAGSLAVTGAVHNWINYNVTVTADQSGQSIGNLRLSGLSGATVEFQASSGAAWQAAAVSSGNATVASFGSFRIKWTTEGNKAFTIIPGINHGASQLHYPASGLSANADVLCVREDNCMRFGSGNCPPVNLLRLCECDSRLAINPWRAQAGRPCQVIAPLCSAADYTALQACYPGTVPGTRRIRRGANMFAKPRGKNHDKNADARQAEKRERARLFAVTGGKKGHKGDNVTKTHGKGGSKGAKFGRSNGR